MYLWAYCLVFIWLSICITSPMLLPYNITSSPHAWTLHGLQQGLDQVVDCPRHYSASKPPSVRSNPVYCVDRHCRSVPVPWVSVHSLSLTHRTAARLSAASQSNGVMSPMTVRWNRLWIGNDGVWRCWKHWLCLVGGYNLVLEHSSLSCQWELCWHNTCYIKFIV